MKGKNNLIKNISSFDECYDALAKAVVMQAIEDVLYAKKIAFKFKGFPKTYEISQRSIYAIERDGKDALEFLQSDRIQMYTDIPSSVIIKQINVAFEKWLQEKENLI